MPAIKKYETWDGCYTSMYSNRSDSWERRSGRRRLPLPRCSPARVEAALQAAELVRKALPAVHEPQLGEGGATRTSSPGPAATKQRSGCRGSRRAARATATRQRCRRHGCSTMRSSRCARDAKLGGVISQRRVRELNRSCASGWVRERAELSCAMPNISATNAPPLRPSPPETRTTLALRRDTSHLAESPDLRPYLPYRTVPYRTVPHRTTPDPFRLNPADHRVRSQPCHLHGRA